MLTHRRGRDGFMVFLLMVVCCSFFRFVGDSFWFRFSIGTHRRGRRGELFSRFSCLWMSSGVTLVN